MGIRERVKKAENPKQQAISELRELVIKQSQGQEVSKDILEWLVRKSR